MAHPANRLNAVRLVRGQTKKLNVSIKTTDGRPAKLQGAKLYMSVSRGPDEDVLIAKTLDSGIEVVDLAKAEARITLTSTETDLLTEGVYRYDIWIELAGTPPERYPVVVSAEIQVLDSVTSFTA